VFHDESFLKDPKLKEINEQKVKRKLEERIENSISYNKPLICVGYHLPGFSFESFTIPVDFSESIFMDPVYFMNCQFTNKVWFRGAHFTREANFNGAHFKEDADFSKAEFGERASFNGTSFQNKADFFEAHFKEEADFSEAHFGERASFNGVEFAGKVWFYHAHFNAGATFGGLFSCQFIKRANFDGAHFKEEADFHNARFTDIARFQSTQFAEADFSAARFQEKANFQSARFQEKANFSNAQFNKEVNISGSQFVEKADFSEAYIKKTEFTKAKFKEVNFYKAQFTEKADFSEIQSTIEKAYPRMDFHNVQFDIPEHITFLKDDLSESSFVNTDITRVRFGEDVVWGDRSKIREEREIENQLKTTNYPTDIKLRDVLAIYRNLRENYEFRMRYDEAGEFFIREMEMKRLYKQNTKNEKYQIKRNNPIIRNVSLTGLYYHFSKYGQSIFRPFIFGIVIVAVSTLLWSIQPNAAGDFLVYNTNASQIVNSSNLQLAFERSLTNFLPSLSFGTELNVGLLDVVFKIVGGAVTFGLIIIALRRKFERKFRH
jgi:uncharacterized protein YjbI with pentapeptide repeats